MAQKKRSEKVVKNIPESIIGPRKLFKKSYETIIHNKKKLAGILLIYAVLYFIFVMGFSLTSSMGNAVNTGASKISQASTTLSYAVSNMYNGNSQSDAVVLTQLLLFLVAVMATIWLLRKLDEGKDVKVLDAFYEGTAHFIPTLVVATVLVLSLIPALIAGAFLSVALKSSGSSMETTIVFLLSVLALFFGLLLFTMLWPAFYISATTRVRPMKAFKQSIALTKLRRTKILGRITLLFIVLLVLFFVVLYFFAMISTGFIPYVLFILVFIIFLFSQVYLYKLYGSLE